MMKGWALDRLPRPTRDAARLKADLDEFGYAVVAEALSAEETRLMRERLNEQAELERELGHEIADQVYDAADGSAGASPNQWVYGLINKGRIFQAALVQPLVRELIRHVLGEEHVLSDMTAHIIHPGSPEMGLHTDQWYMPPLAAPGGAYVKAGDVTRHNVGPRGDPAPAKGPILPPLATNTIWMLCEFSEANGATRVVPRSHLSGQQPDPEGDYEAVGVEGGEGCAIVWDARLWHGAGANTSKAARYGLVTPCRGPQLRQRVNFPFGTRRELVAEMPSDLRRFLGFKSWSGMGHTDDPRAEMARPAEETLGELRRGDLPTSQSTPGRAGEIDRYWRRFCERARIDPVSRHLVRAFGDPEKAGHDVIDSLVDAVKQGKKRGTSPCLKSFEMDGLPLPEAGEYWIVTDSKSSPACVVRVEKVETQPFEAVGDAWAAREGEADGSHEYWYAMHRWWHRKLYREWGLEWTDDEPVVLIHFDLVPAPAP